MNWLLQALCSQVDQGDLFFPGKGAPATPAQRICLQCPVRQQCLEHALTDPSLDGVWGGTTPRMRQHLRTHGVAA